MDDPALQRAYQRGVRALGGQDFYQWQWRVHIGLWAAANASGLEGDFVECGVNYGFLSSAVMEFVDWDRLGKTFYLLDTFAGLDPRFVTAGERRAGAVKKSRRYLRYGFYNSSVDRVRANFAQWRDLRIIVGAVPESLGHVDAHAIAFLHIDMNCAAPEVDTLCFFWPRLSPELSCCWTITPFLGPMSSGSLWMAWRVNWGVPICALPTGQGLLVKPAR